MDDIVLRYSDWLLELCYTLWHIAASHEVGDFVPRDNRKPGAGKTNAVESSCRRLAPSRSKFGQGDLGYVLSGGPAY